ncbi:hypothetical protein [Rhabdothermincola salaria]|uniref:hypothetical protein n=1 Tax=Rhabdothermincola salaria TaxID=2903142 RepID=UPI001E5AD3CB|nr:hypothetical protein [Rhabdothermincola salaria]MCD9622369.1 hypothetical protein [Rhabdothermincola salaria]
MTSEHYVLLGVARPRAGWFTEVGRWANSAALPADFVRCVSVEEVRARLTTGRAWSALLLDQSVPGLERDLIDEARQIGCATIVITDGYARRDWIELGAAAVLDEPVHRDALLDVLRAAAPSLDRPATSGSDLVGPTLGGAWEGRLVAVTGGGGTGASTVAAAVSQALAADPAHGGRVALVDAALDASQALLHDTGDVVPGLQELVEAHRTGELDPEQVRALTWHCAEHGYDLVLGLRRHRDWTVLRPRAVEAAFTALRRSYSVTVADVDDDVEGLALTGSTDVEDRNVLARHLTRIADLVLVSARASVTGLHRLVRTVGHLLEHGVEAPRLVPVITQAPRSARSRADVSRAVAELAGPAGSALTTSPLFVAHRKDLDSLQRDGAPLPGPLVDPLGAAVSALLRSMEPAGAEGGLEVPVPIRPGSLGEGMTA